jgi:protein TonB
VKGERYVHNPYGDEPRLNRFLLISVVLHAILFFTLPELGARLEADVPGMAGGGVIQIMHVERSVNPRPSPVTDPLSQGTVPRVTDPRPTPEEPPKQEAVAQPQEPVVEEPLVERASPDLPEPEYTPEPEPTVVEEEPAVPEPPREAVVEDIGAGELISSEAGPEVAAEPQPLEAVEPPVEARPQPEEERPVSQNVSGSGTGTGGSDDQPGTSESGSGTAQTAPPPPPPPASGRGLHGGGVPTYPKNAEHDGVEGVVFLVIEVSADGKLLNVVLEGSSGDNRLDVQAMRYVEGMWTFASQPYDYSMQVAVVFSKEDNRFVSNVEYGEVNWLNVP